MNAQEYYDLLVSTSKAGKFPCVQRSPTGRYSCLYRHPDGRACAVGLIMPDSYYKPEMESKIVTDLIDYDEDWIPKGLTEDDLANIQFAHDKQVDAFDCKNWNHDKFVRELNRMSCFHEIKKEEVL